ncbi:MAG: hypothetical protein GX774_21175 [Armatimonadetes bacterium]|nr:hypothetical protein [Armatimonadota bacterium]
MSAAYLFGRAPLAPRALAPLPLGSIRAEGWLLGQLRLQAASLTGHLDEFWPDLGPDNLWLGGTREGWERGPYYADGLIPLAYLLADDRLQAKARRWVEALLRFQDDTGWIGPVQAPGRRPYDAWPAMIVLKGLTQYQEATGDDRVIPYLIRFCGYLRDYLDERPLFDWGASRWGDLALSLCWLYERTGEAWLLELMDRAHQQGYDWIAHFRDFAFTRKLAAEECVMHTHVVNNAMAVKTPGVWYRRSLAESDRQAVALALANLDRYHGQATGVFSGDEHYAGRDPSQGTELCAVVELMFSLECLLSILGEPALADRLEKIAYNALPAAFSPDMWAHQYDQQANQVLCTRAPRQWTNNGPDSNLFGLEPNYGCCTANLHQGWPKLVAHLWLATPDEGLAAAAYGPCRVTARVRGGQVVTVVDETDYPFGETIRFRVEAAAPLAFPLWLRVPAWAEEASLRVGGAPAVLAPGTFHVIERTWSPGDVVELHLPMAVRAARRYREALTLERGPLVYALKIGEEWRQIGGELPHGDWEVYPTTPWNYGLCLDPDHLGASVEVRTRPVGEVPFSPDGAPVELRVLGRRVPEWTLWENSAGPLPPSPVASSAPEETLTLIPYGCTNLRVTEFPQIAPPRQGRGDRP